MPSAKSMTLRRIGRVFLPALLLAGLAGCSGNTFNEHGISFQYPEEWQEIPGVQFRSSTAGNQVARETIGLDTRNWATIAIYRINVPITAANLANFKDQITASIRDLTRRANGRIEGGPHRVTMGTFPGFRYEISGRSPDGVRVFSRIVLVFDETTEYFLNCQHTAARTEEIQAGCDEIMETFGAG